MSGLSGEDRERVEKLAAFNREQVAAVEDDEAAVETWFDESALGSDLIADADALTRALALIDQQEKALEAADELERVFTEELNRELIENANWPKVATARNLYRSARAASTEGES